MKIVKLEADKVKVILSSSDLKGLDIDAETISPDSPELSPFLCKVLEAVKEETGFSVDEEQVIVEATRNDGGLVLMISKMAKHAERSKLHAVRAVRRNESAVFEFGAFEDLLDMLKNAAPVYIINMRLYGYRGRFYLAVPKRRIPVLIYEYSLKCRKAPIAEAIVAEYGSFLAGGYRLCSMAAGIKKLN